MFKKKYKETWGIESVYDYSTSSYYPAYQVVDVLLEIINTIKDEVKIKVIDYSQRQINVSVEGSEVAVLALKIKFCTHFGKFFSLKDGKIII